MNTIEAVKGDLTRMSLAQVDAARKKWDAKWQWAKTSLEAGTGSQSKVDEAREGLTILQKATSVKRDAQNLHLLSAGRSVENAVTANDELQVALQHASTIAARQFYELGGAARGIHAQVKHAIEDQFVRYHF